MVSEYDRGYQDGYKAAREESLREFTQAVAATHEAMLHPEPTTLLDWMQEGTLPIANSHDDYWKFGCNKLREFRFRKGMFHPDVFGHGPAPTYTRWMDWDVFVQAVQARGIPFDLIVVPSLV